MTDQRLTRNLGDLLEDIYRGQERMTQAEIQRRAVAAQVPADLLIRLDRLPEGEYAVDEVADLLGGSLVEAAPKPEATPEALPDFAAEHDTTAVSEDITTGRDKQREEESPHGWSGLQP